MNILILNWRDIKHPLGGGAEIFLHEHAKYWVKQGANVIWFTSSYKGSRKQEVIDGITILRKGSIFTVYIHAALYYVRYLRKQIDIVFDNFHFIPFFTPWYVKKKKIIAVIHEVAGNVWYKNFPFPFAFIGEKLEPLFFIFYKHIPFITVSESTEQELIDIGMSKKMITVIHNGITLPKIKKTYKKEKVPTILFLGRISLDKGIIEAITSFVEILKLGVNYRLWIVGREEKKGIIKKVLTQYIPKQFYSYVTYFGFVSEEKKYQLLQKVWVVINPSYKEGWGLTVLEANSVGTSVVGYNVAGLRDSIKNGKTGILTKNNTPQEMAKEVVTLLQDKKKYATLSRQAKLFAKNFSWKQAGERSWNIIKTVYANQKRK